MAAKTLEQRLDILESNIKYMRVKVDKIDQTLEMALLVHPEEKIMSVKDVAAFLAIDEDKIYRMCKKGELPYVKMGKLLKFRKSELIAWRKKRRKDEEGSIDSYVTKYLEKNPLKR